MNNSESKKRGRPSGSKNTFTKKEIEKLQAKVDELEKSSNSYESVLDGFVDGFILELQNQVKTISMDKLQSWFSNPDKYMTEINDLLTYYYIIDGNISQMYDLIFALPPLNYKIKPLERLSSYESDMAKIKNALERTVKHKQLTRELLVQLAHSGSVLGTWLGNNKEPYFNVFDNLDYIYPYGNYKGRMVGVFDLQYLDTLNDDKKKLIFDTLNPFITPKIYQKYKDCTDNSKRKELQLVVLPPDRSLVARTRVLSKNQRLGLPYGTQSIFDLQHKQKMKELERAIADKIVRAIAIVKFKDKDEFEGKVKESVQKKVFSKVKKALEQNNSNKNGLTCLAMPSFADFSFPEIKNADKILSPDKYDSVDDDITMGTGISSVLSNGTKGNYASANANLEMIYKRIGTMLEQIEEIYNQLIIIVLGKSKGSKYLFEYDKEMPISKKDKLNMVKSLTDKGYSMKCLTDMLGVDFDELVRDSIYEIETLKLRERIIPPLTSFTITGDDTNQGNKPEVEPFNDSTEQDKSNDGKNNPKPSKK
jgi:hypothetical protein